MYWGRGETRSMGRNDLEYENPGRLGSKLFEPLKQLRLQGPGRQCQDDILSHVVP